MIQSNGKLPFSQYSYLYDIVVPKGHRLRRILDILDFTFIYDELKDKYSPDNGRMAVDPVMMFKYLFLKVLYGLSDRFLVERCMSDMSFKYFLGLNPEDAVINPTSLTKFRRMRLKDKDMMNILLRKSVEIAQDKGLIDGSTIIVDSTHTLSRSTPARPAELLQRQSKHLRKLIYSVDEDYKSKLPSKYEGSDLKQEMDYIKALTEYVSSDPHLAFREDIAERTELLKETVSDIEDHYTTSSDRDARTGHKTQDSEFFGYKTHIAMTPERLIVAAEVTSGEKGDGPQLPGLINASMELLPNLRRVVGDGAYAGDRNLEAAEEKGLAIVAKVNRTLARSANGEKGGFIFNKDADTMACPAGHLAIRMRHDDSRKKQTGWMAYVFDRNICKTCPLGETCPVMKKDKSGHPRYIFRATKNNESRSRQLAFMKTEEYAHWSKERYKIEAKNSEIKNRYGYDRADYYGLYGMKIQGAVALFASNISRILKLEDEKVEI